jgi:hypothetical protein
MRGKICPTKHCFHLPPLGTYRQNIKRKKSWWCVGVWMASNMRGRYSSATIVWSRNMCNIKSVSRTGNTSVWVTVVFIVSYSGTFLQELLVTEGMAEVRIFYLYLACPSWNYTKLHEAHRSGSHYRHITCIQYASGRRQYNYSIIN